MTPPLHILSVMGFVWRDKYVLMIESPRRGWECPGGQVEQGENPLDALRREVEEEAGVEIEVERLASVNTNIRRIPQPNVIMDFVCRYVSGEPRSSAESLRVAFFSPEQAVARATCPCMQSRLAHLIAFDGRVRFMSFGFNPYEVIRESVM